MDYHIDNGTLVFTLEKDEIENWNEEKSDKGYIDIETIFAESGLSGNCDLESIRPEEIGALTDAPIFGENTTRDDMGDLIAIGNVWWYPNYMIEDPVDILLETGSVRFMAAPENKKAA